MLLEKVTNRLKGQVRIHVTAAFPERVLNLCGARNLAFWDVQWISATEFECTLSRQDCAALRQSAEHLNCAISTKTRAGVPFLLGRLRRRHVLAAGMCACALLVFVGSFFIWDFEITGNQTVPDEEILRALEKNGVGLGTFCLSVDQAELRNHVLLDLPKLSWIAVNVSGCKAHVQIRERVPKPELLNRQIPSNLVARRDGVVTRVEAWNGEKLVLPGTTVESGQILISGVQDTGTFGARLVAGIGKVYARTWYRLSTEIPLNVEKKVYLDGARRRFSLIFGTKRIKFYGNGSYSTGRYDKITRRTPLRPFGLPTPLTAETECFVPYAVVRETLPAAEAQKRGRKILEEYLRSLLDGEGKISSVLCAASRRGDTLTVTLNAECTEQIGRKEPVYTEQNADGTPAQTQTKERSQVGAENQH